MIVFGTRGVTTTAGSGSFHCPACRADLPFQHKRVRRFFTLYFIPLIPMESLGEYVECQHCRGTFRMEVLDLDLGAEEAAFQAAFHQAMVRVMVLMALADGVVDRAEIETIQRVYSQLTGNDLADADIRSEIDKVHHEGRDVQKTLGPLAGQLSDRGREMVVQAAFLVATADGRFDESEEHLLHTVGQTLNMTEAHLTGVIQSLGKE